MFEPYRVSPPSTYSPKGANYDYTHCADSSIGRLSTARSVLCEAQPHTGSPHTINYFYRPCCFVAWIRRASAGVERSERNGHIETTVCSLATGASDWVLALASRLVGIYGGYVGPIRSLGSMISYYFSRTNRTQHTNRTYYHSSSICSR